MTSAQYFTDTRNKMMFPLVIDDNGKTRNCALETYVSDHELKYNIYFDNMHDEENDKYIVKYVELFLKSFGKEIKDRIEALDILTKTYNVTFNGFDIHKADKYQVIDDGIFRVTFESSSDERNLNVNIGFNTTELQVLSNKEYLSKESIKTYMESNKDKILSNIKVNSNNLNSFYASIARITKRRKKKTKLLRSNLRFDFNKQIWYNTYCLFFEGEKMTNIILMIFSLISFPSKEVDENNFKYIDTQIKVNVSEFKEKKELYEKKNYFNGESKEEIANKLNRYLNSTLKGKGKFIVDYSFEVGMDPYLATGVMLQETGCYWTCSYLTRVCNNVGGNKGGPSCNGGSYRRFDTIEEGIKFAINKLNSYYSKGKTTTYEIGPYYASDPKWPTRVNNYINKLKK